MWRSSRLWNSLLNSSETALPAVVVSPIYYYINPHVGPIFIRYDNVTLRYHQIIPNFVLSPSLCLNAGKFKICAAFCYKSQ